MFYRKRKIKNVVVLDKQSAAHLTAFLIKQNMLFLFHVSNVLGVCSDRTPHMHKPDFYQVVFTAEI